MCQRCTRFAEEIPGDPFIALVERGAMQQIGIAEDAPFSVLRRQRDPDLPGRCADERGLPLPLPPLRPGLHAGRRRARLVRLRDPRRPPRAAGDAPARGQRPRGQRGVDHRQGPVLPSTTRPSPTGSPTPGPRPRRGRRRPAATRVVAGGPSRSPRAACRRRATGVLTGGRITAEDGSPTASSPGSPWAPTTSTSGRGRSRPRRLRSSRPRSSCAAR